MLLSKAKPSYAYSISKPHGESARGSLRQPLCEAKLSYIYWTWSEFQRPSQTSAAHGKDGLHMFYFKAKELEAKSDH